MPDHTFMGRNGTWFGYDADFGTVHIEGDLDGESRTIIFDGADLVEFVIHEAIVPALTDSIQGVVSAWIATFLAQHFPQTKPPPVPGDKQ